MFIPLLLLIPLQLVPEFVVGLVSVSFAAAAVANVVSAVIIAIGPRVTTTSIGDFVVVVTAINKVDDVLAVFINNIGNNHYSYMAGSGILYVCLLARCNQHANHRIYHAMIERLQIVRY